MKLEQTDAAFPGGFKTVIFDCDSTLSAVEGIDELGREHGSAISSLTEAAMRGEVSLEDVYARRLEIVRPTREQVRRLGELYVSRMVEDARDVCQELTRAGIEVRILSGGLLPAVNHLAQALGVAHQNVAAVNIFFHSDGSYRDFDRNSQLARSGGKLAVVKSWSSSLPRPVMLVGDGSTDLEAREAVELFVAYAGVVARENVLSEADVVIRSHSLAPVFRLAVGSSTTALSSAAARLWQRGAEAMHRHDA